MLSVIDKSYKKYCKPDEPKNHSLSEQQESFYKIETPASDSEYLSPVMDAVPEHELNLLSLKSALAVLEPDCDDRTWKFHRIAPLANAAIDHPEHVQELFQLACDFSSGKLQNKPSKKWGHPSNVGGKSGREVIFSIWNRFISSSSDKKKISVGTIYYHAQEAGWEYEGEGRK